ncbi:sirohydrochlorin chelatase [Williamsia sterculiae]|uniref:Sirohydrochlorin ferrochelatase n=1 Tax=Williamsia sterculiae TaxID=1344003 RepID=A0A1N7FY95_9NOCA|nr:CbiX/SirB N-terminal domain-containing protein [Williamsia sterculiae]SIS05292.1 Sirohydrochlorin ferrochelatase [Williamsia sterculiae]
MADEAGAVLRRTPVLVAHGTRAAAGVETIARLADMVGERVGPTRVAFVDVLGPSPAEVLTEVVRPAVVVPAFLASGYHVRTDLPAGIVASGHHDTVVTPALGPDPVLAQLMMRRLREAGWCPGDGVVLAAAGSSDAQARAEVHVAADQLARLVGGDVPVGFLTSAAPTVVDAVTDFRRINSGRRVFLAAYLLAPGLFHRRLAECGADGVADPLGADPMIADLVASRMVLSDQLTRNQSVPVASTPVRR